MVRRNLIIRLSRSVCSAFFSGLEVIHETATILSQATAELVGNISCYLKVLAAADVIEEVPELAKNRRERWWRTAKASYDEPWIQAAFSTESLITLTPDRPRPAKP
jgi:hypothetical protein